MTINCMARIFHQGIYGYVLELKPILGLGFSYYHGCPLAMGYAQKHADPIKKEKQTRCFI